MINCAYLLFVLFHTCLGSIKLVAGSDPETTGQFFCNPAPPEGSVYARFNKLLNEYFSINFRDAGTAYLKSLGDCPGDKIEQNTSVELRDAIIAEMSHVVESYGKREDVGVIERVKRITRRDQRPINKPRFRVHRLVALILHFSQNPTSGVPSVENIKYENAVRKSKQRRLQDAYVSWIKIYKRHKNKVVHDKAEIKRLEIRDALIVDALTLIGNTFTLDSYKQTLNALILAGRTVVTHFLVCDRGAKRPDDVSKLLYGSACEHIPKLLKDCTTVGKVLNGLKRINFFFHASPTQLNPIAAFSDLNTLCANELTSVGLCEKVLPEIKTSLEAIYDQIIGFVFDPKCSSYCDHALTNEGITFTCRRQKDGRNGKLQKLKTLFSNFKCSDYTDESFKEQLGEISSLKCSAIPLTHD